MINKMNNLPLNLQATSVYNFNEFTLTELLNRFFTKINECVDVSNQALNFLIWLKGEGLPIEIEKELEKMYTDGRLTSLIDELSGNLTELVNQTNTSLNNLVNETNSNIEGLASTIGEIQDIDLLKDDLIFFSSYANNKEDYLSDFTLYVTNNTKECYPINTKPLLSFETNRRLWDMCTFYNNGKFYFIGDYKDNDEFWGGNAFLLIETSDFITFKQTPFKYRSTTKNITQTWAPKIIKILNQIYLVTCVQIDNETFERQTLLGGTDYKLKMCYSTPLDDTLTRWSEPIFFDIGTNDSYIDPYLVYFDNEYHLFGTNNIGQIVHFKSSNINGNYTLSDIVPIPNVTEAPSIIRFKDKYYMFVDSYRATGRKEKGFTQVLESYDLTNWTNLKEFKSCNGEIMRHFAPITIVDDKQKEVISNLFKRLKINNNYINSLNGVLTSTKKDKSYFDLASITPSATSVIEELIIQPNTVYYKNANVGSISIKKVNASKLKNHDEFSFVLNSFDEDNSITIKNLSDKGAFLPSRGDLVINGNMGSNLYNFTCYDGYIKCLTPISPNVKGVGVGKSDMIVTSGNDFECKYILKNNVCVVSYILKFESEPVSESVLVTGLPKPSMAVSFVAPINTTDDVKYATFRINDNGEIQEWYGVKPTVGTLIKGSFSYITK